ncbi:MAG TPA: peptidyl-alpha-hydroxyglycine alpha-amidating lyase family protein [Planctomycetaceae bacterium]|nr:peptidyl-alpha-hydroxyglycine alpha-amidating lyase family protein [Planctomycetaceae bacterium]
MGSIGAMTGDSDTQRSDGASTRGADAHRYRVVAGWPRLPAGCDLVEVAAVATDSQDRVYVFNRGRRPVVVFSEDGDFLHAWGEGLFARAHGITIGPDDAVYCVDDVDHTVRKFTTDGRLLMTLGASGRFSDTGATSLDFRTIQQSGPPFHYPTDLALAPSGELYVSDGYGNARVHRFSAEGTLIGSWGEPGDGPGQFRIPHGIAVDAQGRVYVADRENSRIQRFTRDGESLDEWADIARPCEVFIDPDGAVYVAELGYRAGMWPGISAPHPDATGGRLSVFNLDGELLTHWGGGENPCAPGDFFAPHDVWVDRRGSVYVSEVVMSAGGNRGLVPSDCHCVQKFARIETAE